jgi:pSer/pThr/pTyr-binding forkhead associated (FHA) protein
LIRQADGSYLLRDQGSTAGTWVNYQPLDEKGISLQHGDIIHFGMAEFRFELAAPPEPRAITVMQEGEQPTDLIKESRQDGS